MKKLFVVLIILFVLLLIIAAVSIPIINSVVLPKITEQIGVKSGEFINGKLTINEVKYYPWKGISISDVSLTLFEDGIEKPVLKSKYIYIKPHLLALIFRRDIIIGKLEISQAHLYLERDQQNQFNIQKLIKQRSSAAPSDTKSDITPVIHSIQLTDATIQWDDRSLAEPFSAALEDINLTARLSIFKKIAYKLAGRLADKDSHFTVKGTYDLSKQSAEAAIKLRNMDLTFFEPYYKDALPLQLSGADLNGGCVLQMPDHDTLNLSIDGTLSDLDVSKQENRLQGDIDIRGDVIIPLNTPAELSYDLILETKNMMVRAQEIDAKIQANASLAQDKLDIDSFTANVLDNEINGNILVKDFKAPSIEGELETALDIHKILPLLPSKYKKNIEKINIIATPSFSGTFTIQLNNPETLRIDGLLSVRDASFMPVPKKQVEQFSGDITFTKDSISSSNLNFIFDGAPYSANVNASSLRENPTGTLDLSGRDLNLHASAIMTGNDISLQDVKGNYQGIAFTLLGDINNIKDPILNLYGTVQLDIEDLAPILPQAKKVIDQYNIKGNVDSNIFIAGKARDPKGLEIGIKGKSPKLFFWKLKFPDAAFDVRMKDKNVTLVSFVTTPYGGNINATGSVDLSQQNPPCQISAEIFSLDLRELNMDLMLAQKELYGKLFAKLDVDASIKDLQDSVTGTASLLIEDGNIWEFKPMEEIAAILQIAGIKQINFTKAEGNFDIGNNRVATEDFTLYSEELRLEAKGNVDFDSNLDFHIGAIFTSQLLKNTGQDNLFDVFVDQAGLLRGDIKLTGTIQDPKTSMQAPKVKDIIQKGIKGILEGILE